MLQPLNRMVIRYEFQFKHQEHGGPPDEWHPCMILKVFPAMENGDRKVIVTPISHTPPHEKIEGVPVPSKVAEYVGLDDRPMWIKPLEMNRFIWPQNERPPGIVQLHSGEWSYPNLMPERTATPAKRIAQWGLDHQQTKVIDMDRIMQRYEKQIERQEQFKPEPENELDPTDD